MDTVHNPALIDSNWMPLACPKCGTAIRSDVPNPTVCGHCHTVWPVVDGLVSLAENTGFYYGEVNCGQMQQLTADLREQGLARAFENLYPTLGRTRDWVCDYALNELRFPWIALLGVGQKDLALDIGSGWGNASIQLARLGCRVVAMDLAVERLRFVASRFAQEGLTAATVLHADAGSALPFPANTFSIVVMNGVLEWIPESTPGSPPRIQLNALAEAGRVLRPGGTLVIGIENRYSWRYLRGDPEDHTALRFGALLPRFIADIYSRRKRSKPYRTYTHSWRTYSQMLRRAGFEHLEFFCPLPDYRVCQHLFDLSDDRACRAAIGTLVRCGRKGRMTLRLIHRLFGLAMVVPSFIIFARIPHGVHEE